MTLSAYCLTCWDASSSLLMCNPSVWVNDCKIGPSRCTCAGKTEHAGGRRATGAVWLRWAHTRLHREGETASRAGGVLLLFSAPEPSFEHWKQICSAYPQSLEMVDRSAWSWKLFCFPPANWSFASILRHTCYLVKDEETPSHQSTVF